MSYDGLPLPGRELFYSTLPKQNCYLFVSVVLGQGLERISFSRTAKLTARSLCDFLSLSLPPAGFCTLGTFLPPPLSPVQFACMGGFLIRLTKSEASLFLVVQHLALASPPLRRQRPQKALHCRAHRKM